jgi:hypothetical protein
MVLAADKSAYSLTVDLPRYCRKLTRPKKRNMRIDMSCSDQMGWQPRPERTGERPRVYSEVPAFDIVPLFLDQMTRQVERK